MINNIISCTRRATGIVGGVHCSTVVRTSVCDQRTFPGLRHDVQLTSDLFEVNCPLYVSHSSSCGQ